METLSSHKGERAKGTEEIKTIKSSF